MKTPILIAAALAVVLAAPAVQAGEKHDGVEISFDSEDPRVDLGDRHSTAASRLAVNTRNGAATLLITNRVVAVQLSDATLAKIKTEGDASFLEKLIVSGVRGALEGAVNYPIAHIRSAEIRDGVLVLTSDEGKPVFDSVKIDGENVTHDLSTADATRFVREFRRIKSAR